MLFSDKNPALIETQIDELQKVLLKCRIESNPEKYPLTPLLPHH